MNNRLEILSLPATSQDTTSWLSDPSLPWLDSTSLQSQQQPIPSQPLSPSRPDLHHVSPSNPSSTPALTTAATAATIGINNNDNNNNNAHTTTNTFVNNNILLGSTSPITRLPVDILLYIASLRFLTLNDIIQWRTTARVFYHSIPLPNAAMVKKTTEEN
jgi:hypothetical protein